MIVLLACFHWLEAAEILKISTLTTNRNTVGVNVFLSALFVAHGNHNFLEQLEKFECYH